MIARFGVWTLDSDRRLITGDHDDAVHLTPKAFDLLTILIDEAPRVVSKEELHRRLWPGVFVTDATLVGLVKEVRRAFREAASDPSIIRTSHGVGYAFAGSIDRPLSMQDVASYWVVVGNRRIRLTGSEVIIGRGAASDVRLDAAGVSRRHARILMTPTGPYLEDLGSKNGTMLGETRCPRPTPLQDGDTIRLGPVSMIFRASEPGTSTATATME